MANRRDFFKRLAVGAAALGIRPVPADAVPAVTLPSTVPPALQVTHLGPPSTKVYVTVHGSGTPAAIADAVMRSLPRHVAANEHGIRDAVLATVERRR